MSVQEPPVKVEETRHGLPYDFQCRLSRRPPSESGNPQVSFSLINYLVVVNAWPKQYDVEPPHVHGPSIQPRNRAPALAACKRIVTSFGNTTLRIGYFDQKSRLSEFLGCSHSFALFGLMYYPYSTRNEFIFSIPSPLQCESSIIKLLLPPGV